MVNTVQVNETSTVSLPSVKSCAQIQGYGASSTDLCLGWGSTVNGDGFVRHKEVLD